jgi:hypothetical protein
MTQPPMSGLSGLIDFTDNLQEADTGLDRIALLRQMQQPPIQQPLIQRELGGDIPNMEDIQTEESLPGLIAMEELRNLSLASLMKDNTEDLSEQDYMQYAASGGLVGLPVVQAGFGSFIKRAFKSITKPISRAVKSIGKSKLGRIALAVAPTMFGLPPWQAALVTGGLTKAGGGDWGDALRAGALAYGGGKLAEGFKGAQAVDGVTKTGIGTGTKLGQVGDLTKEVIGSHAAGTGTATTSVWKDLAQSVLGGPEGAVYNPSGTFVSRLGERLANVGQFKDTSALEELGLEGLLKDKAAQTPDLQNQAALDLTTQAGKEQALTAVQDNILKSASDAAKDPTMLSNIIKKGTDFIKEKPLTAIAGGASILSSLIGGKSEAEIDPSIAGLTREVVDTDFDKQVFQYYKDGQPIDTETALGLIAEAYRSYDPEGRTDAVIDSGVRSDISLQNNGGLIGMAYGGEFAGQVGGRGHGMEDNVYMPILEKQAGEQVGTLAVSPDEYVVDSYTMSLLGNGSPDAGAKVMDKTIKDIRLRATGQPNQQREIDGLEALNRMRSV